MARNIIFEDGEQLRVNVANVTGTGPDGATRSGDPGVVGDLPFVALTDEDGTGYATVKLDGVAELAVKAEGGAIGVGTILYFDAADPTKINNSSSGNKRFGYALGAVADGETATIPVKIGY